MRKAALLFVTFAGSAVCWWPAIITPNLNFPPWIILVLVALIPASSVLLSDGRGWWAYVLATAGGSVAGLLSGVILWPSPDGIAQTYALFVVLIGTALAALVALMGAWTASLAAARLALSNRAPRNAVWVMLGICVATGPTLFALTPLLVKRRVERSESMAAVRFASLQKALELTRADRGPATSLCDGETLEKYYSGPPFTREDWIRISGNAVQKDDYFYSISCGRPGTYRLEAQPKLPNVYGYGTRLFCADDSGKTDCNSKSSSR